MYLTKSMKNSFDKIKSVLGGEHITSVTQTADQIQCSSNDYTVILGLHSLRLTIVNNIDNTAIVITPCHIKNENGVYLHHMGTVFHIFNTNENIVKEYNTLNIDSGELFQMSTLYSCNFTDTSRILPFFLEIIKKMENLKREYNKEMVPEAILNITNAIEKYNSVT
ncbi:hypothetical protein WJW27_005300 [Escherichia coli]|uniref:hypothetical protein n=1 Tax=Escherichia coli TaxID=562 RepID=UPI0023771493|nr:hypothetical protein vBEcoMphAPEC6_00730 [Escherichia phage ph0011]